MSNGSHSAALEFVPGSYSASGPLYRYFATINLGDLSQEVNGAGSKMLGLYLSTEQSYSITMNANQTKYDIMVKTTGGEMSEATALNCDETSAGSGLGYCNYNLPEIGRASCRERV